MIDLIAQRLAHLEAALRQFGPWQGQKLNLTPAWLVDRLEEKIRAIDWKKAANDVERFL